MNKKYFDTHLQKKQYNKANENNNIDLEDYKNIPILFKFITYICSYQPCTQNINNHIKTSIWKTFIYKFKKLNLKNTKQYGF